MLQGEHSAILLTFIKPPFVIKIFVLSIFEWLLKTGFSICVTSLNVHAQLSSGLIVALKLNLLLSIHMHSENFGKPARIQSRSS